MIIDDKTSVVLSFKIRSAGEQKGKEDGVTQLINIDCQKIVFFLKIAK